MELEKIALIVLSFLVSIIGFFLKKVLDDHEKTKEMSIKNQAKLDLIENNYNHLDKKFDMLYQAVSELTKEIKQLNIQLVKKKD